VVTNDWVLPVAVVGGGSLLAYGLYKWMAGGTTPPPENHLFSDLAIFISPNPAESNGNITISGSFKYAGPGGNFRLIAEVGHTPFSTIFQDSGYTTKALAATGGKTYSFSIAIKLTEYSSSIGSPFDILIRYYDLDNSETFTQETFDSELVVNAASYTTGYSVSPAHAGYYIKGGYYGTESGSFSEEETSDWLDIQVVANSGYAFDHWETTGELWYDDTVNDNMIKNDQDKTLVAVFVPENTVATWSFEVQPLAKGIIWLSVNGASSYGIGDQGPETVSFNIGDTIRVWAYPLYDSAYYLQYWQLDGVNYAPDEPVTFDISDTVGHTIVAIMTN
jgi:hypothetical protein